jgi:geranylgeranyl diphosphate synthase type II
MPTDTGLDIEEHLRQVRAEVECHLDRVLGPAPGVPPRLLEAMRYSVLGPGKRLRPVLTVLSARACGGTGVLSVDANPWPAACAVELIHAYSLIHDDLPAMDDDDVRRGRPTCHKQFGEALAILAGDALQALAFQVLAEGYPPEVAGRCTGELARAAGAAGMVGGQADDLAWEEHPTSGAVPTLEILEGIHLRKTGALIRAACVLGAIVADAPRNSLTALDGYGRSLGLAFQVVDDLLDVEGDADTAGKRLRKDAARGKLTYPGLLGVEESRRRARRLGEQAREHLAVLARGERAALGEVERLHDLVTLVLARDS